MEILEEADLIQADRVIEDEEVAKPQRRKEEDYRGLPKLSKVMFALKLEDEEEETQPQQEAMQWEVTACTWCASALLACVKANMGMLVQRSLCVVTAY